MVAAGRPPLDDIDVALTKAAAREGLFGDEHRPTRIGRFEVERTIGFGAMGRVYIARDPDLHRRVALKLIRPLAGAPTRSAELRERLLSEAQTLANLSHPNIVAAYEVGRAGEDVYLVMEYADGEDLRAWLKQRRPWREVVDAFVQAGRGLAAAHRAGIVHRDFKPANVLRGEDERVRVLDFGLAASEDTTPSDDSKGSAPTGRIAGTPGYLAPELVHGTPASPASDQYAFAVSLHEALLGHRPRETAAGAGADVPAWVLDVVQRGLAERPAERWPSMDEMVEALGDDPTAARRRKALVLGALAVAAGAWAWQRYEGRVAAEACAEASEGARRVWSEERRDALRTSFGASTVPIATHARERTKTRLDAHVEAWSRARTDACPGGALGPDLAPRARACLQAQLDELDAAIALLAKAEPDVVIASVELAAQLTPPSVCTDPDVLRRRDEPPQDDAVAEIQRALVDVRLLRTVGRDADALALARETLPRAEALDWSPLVLRARVVLGATEMVVDENLSGRARLRDAFTRAQAEGHDDLAVAAAIALVSTDNAQGRYDEAMLWADMGLALLERLGHSEDVRAGTLLDLRGNVLQARGDLQAARQAHEDALALRRRVHGPDHPHVLGSLVGLANVATLGRRYEDALPQYARALDAIERVLGRDHPLGLLVQTNVAGILLEQGHLDEARVKLEHVVAVREQTFGPDHPTLSGPLQNLGNLAFRGGDLDEAERYFQRALAIEREHSGTGTPSEIHLLGNLAGVAFGRGDLEAALEMSRAVVTAAEEAHGADAPELVRHLANVGNVQVQAGRAKEAAVFFDRALGLAGKHWTDDDPRLEPLLIGLATVAEQEGRPAAALAHYERAHQVARATADAARLEQIASKVEELRAQLDPAD